MTEISFELDGEQVTTNVDPKTPLREVLRDEFGKKGVKSSCDSGRCGVCTVHLDGDAVKSCLVLAPKADGRTVTTIEGLAGETDDLHDVQQAFLDKFATQCGYCIPGMIMTAVDYLEDGEYSGERAEIESALKGNVCRCTGYEKIVDAVEEVANSRS
ncbi:(2Fe-2S)-binding protein [Natrarchaeobius chitinivorans]|uniref:(2Fe-2S)-binding protein n=1 Tax=Natrarchaeobius chitinivorans TaxID=1679083 RepID=A0A3N6LW91_NATCH|nr:(2Fe-2S)-binding protein [Natrarchaeobius chitinivorans]RQG94863.1 (2Fe-2S)-binding protein [Natrarchaeobius chitinivorans]